MDSSSQEPPKSSRRVRKHSRNRKGSADKQTKSTMAISEPESPSSPFSWRLERKTTSSPPKKSHGIAPSRFHAKLEEAVDKEKNSEEIPAWKAQIERNLLIQQQQAHSKKLESRRKEFRKKTQLKTWPLQDMALEHLDHLLGCDANRQFHGGDYLSAESSSSLSSTETSKPRLASRTKRESPKKSNVKRKETNKNDTSNQQSAEGTEKIENPAATSNDDENDETDFHHEQLVSPLWSLEPRIFATEKGNGKRKYLVGEFGRIADWYWRKTAPESRHLYEVIREGSPCRLYFDLEYSKLHNTSVSDAKLLSELEEELATELQLHYGNILPRLKSSQIVNLDSSNEKKFSRHWVVHLFDNGDPKKDSASKSPQEILFKDAPTVGRFVKRMVGRLADDLAADGEEFAKRRPVLAKHLFINTKDSSKQTCFIDLGVYTKNRLFRCLGSSKKGKSTRLEVVLRERECESTEEIVEPQTKDATETGKEPSSAETERYFFPLSIPEKREIEQSQSESLSTPSIDTFIAGNDWEPHAKALADSLVVPLKNAARDSNNQKRILDVEGASESSSLAKFTDTTRKSTQSRYAPSISMTRQGSPVPSLDQYVSEVLATRGGVRGSIRAWSIEYGHRDTPVSFTYHLQRNRFCEIIGRSHKSNNVFWTIDLNSWTCIQGCHDPDCFGRGSPVPIANNSLAAGQSKSGSLLDQIQKEYDSWQEEEFEKALGELNLEDILAEAPSQGKGSQASKDEKQGTEDSDELSDEALLQAIGNNPELFP